MARPPVFHESLPYIDAEPDPAAYAAARALIAAEVEQRQGDDDDANPPSPAFTPALATEMARIASHTPLPPLSLSRYEAQEPPPPPASLRPVLSAACVSAAYLASRCQNLALLDRHGVNAWLLANYHLEHDLRRLEADLARTRRDLDLVNARRAASQHAVRAEMLMLEESWRRRVAAVLETEVAVQHLKAQIRQELKNRSAHDEASQ